MALCSVCFYLSDENECPICSDDSRNKSAIAVVAHSSDVLTLERSSYNGLYHVLHGLISPRNAIGPEQLKIRELVRRIQSRTVKELIFWTPNTSEGNATNMIIIEALKRAGLLSTKNTKAIGSYLETSDVETLGSKSRRGYQGFH